MANIYSERALLSDDIYSGARLPTIMPTVVARCKYVRLRSITSQKYDVFEWSCNRAIHIHRCMTQRYDLNC